MKKTKWFAAGTKPTLPGVYQRDYRNASGDRAVGITYCHWDGKRWAVFGPSPENALQFSRLSSSYQALPWRGLASDPSKGA